MTDSTPIRPPIPIPERYFRTTDRFEGSPARRPPPGPVDTVIAWLAGPARRIERLAELFDEYAWRVVGAGIPAMRMTAHVGTLHPQFTGFVAQWWRDGGDTTDTAILHEVNETQAYSANSIRRCIEFGETVRRRLEGPSDAFDLPILHDLRAQGGTDYLALPVEGMRARRFALTYLTDRPGGFADQEMADLRRLSDLLAMLLVNHGHARIARNLLGAYLGARTGERVLAGQVRRGQGEEIRVVIWSSDLRGFTERSDRLSGQQTIALLNAFFEAQAQAIAAHDGEILKFMGDGLLAIFPVEDALFTGVATRNALAAAYEATAAVRRLVRDPALADTEPLQMVVALHLGPVVYGNIGAADRLDFTVIGPAVNMTSRMEAIGKQRELELITSAAFAAAYDGPLQSLGPHVLRGLAGTHELFTLPSDGTAESG